jgi:hypothetical protein
MRPQPRPRDMLKDKIAASEAQMRARLDEIRATFAQSGDKGSSAEDSFREFLRKYLPRRLAVGHGEVVDLEGRRSRQTDVVIVTEDHPFTFTPDQAGLFFIEGVCGAGEVKTTLTGAELDKALRNSRRFKGLESQPLTGLTYSSPSDQERFCRCPPWFLLAFDSQLSLGRILEKTVQFTVDRGLQATGLLDAVFILGRGWVMNFGDGQGSLQFRTPDGESVRGWVEKESDSVLFDLLGWLSIAMPRMVRLDPVLAPYMVRTSLDSG